MSNQLQREVCAEWEFYEWFRFLKSLFVVLFHFNFIFLSALVQTLDQTYLVGMYSELRLYWLDQCQIWVLEHPYSDLVKYYRILSFK